MTAATEDLLAFLERSFVGDTSVKQLSIWKKLDTGVLSYQYLWNWPQQHHVKAKIGKSWEILGTLVIKNNQPLSEHEGRVHVGRGQPHHVSDLLGDHPQLFKVHETVHAGVVPCTYMHKQCELGG